MRSAMCGWGLQAGSSCCLRSPRRGATSLSVFRSCSWRSHFSTALLPTLSISTCVGATNCITKCGNEEFLAGHPATRFCACSHGGCHRLGFPPHYFQILQSVGLDAVCHLHRVCLGRRALLGAGGGEAQTSARFGV